MALKEIKKLFREFEAAERLTFEADQKWAADPDNETFEDVWDEQYDKMFEKQTELIEAVYEYVGNNLCKDMIYTMLKRQRVAFKNLIENAAFYEGRKG